MSWHPFEISSFVHEEIDICTAKEDHAVAAVTVKMQRKRSTWTSIPRLRIDAQRCTDPEAKAKFQAFLQHPPQVPWLVGPGQHAETITQWLQQGARQCFGKQPQQPRQRYMSHHTWQIVQMRKQLKKMMAQSMRHVQCLIMRVMFDNWYAFTHTALQPATQHPREPTACHMTQIATLIQRCRYTFAWALHNHHRLHTPARHASKQDRIESAKQTVQDFLAAAHSHDSRALYRSLRPLLGQVHRQKTNQFRPIPAVQMADSTLAKNAQEAAQRWQEHFASAEQGQPSSVTELQQLAQATASTYTLEELPFDLQCIPNLSDIELYIHQSRKGKSPGLDGLPSEVYKTFPSLMAKVLWPVYAKCSLQCTEPLRWRGGEIVALPKLQHAGTKVDHFRSILLADFSSKVYPGLIRRRLLPNLQDFRLNLQAGGVPHLGTDMLHLVVQSFAQLTRHRGVSSASVFVDIKQAFYRACRPLLVDQPLCTERLAAFFAFNGWDANMFNEFRAQMHKLPALAQARVSPHQSAQVQSMLQATWFEIKGCPATMTHTSCGTRPGDSIADLLYAFIMARFLKDLRALFIHHELHTTLDLTWTPAGPIQEGDFPPQQIVQACWVDDLVLLLQAPTADDLCNQVRLAIQLTQDLAASYGLSLNYGPNKSAALLALRGPQARQKWVEILQDHPTQPQLSFSCKSLPHTGKLDIVPDYVYLGQLQDQKGHPACEVQRRFQMTKVSSRLLRQNVFRSPKMPPDTKLQLFRALVLSKLVYGAGSWQLPHIQTSRMWQHRLVAMYSQIAPSQKPGPGVTTLDIIADCQLPHPQMLLTVQRFSLFDRMMQSEMLELFAILQAQDPDTGWLTLIQDDVQRLTEICPDHVLLDPSQKPQIAELGNYSFRHPKALTKLSKWAQKLYLQSLKIWRTFRKFQHDFQDDAAIYDVAWTQRPAEGTRPTQHTCETCAASFPTFKALCTHAYKKHGQLNIVHRYASSNVCRACMKMYDARQQVVHHLKYYKTGCLLKLISSVMPLDDTEYQAVLEQERDEAQKLRRTERRKRHRFPVQQAHGPIRPWPWQRYTQIAAQDTRDSAEIPQEVTQEWVNTILQDLPSQDTAATLSTLQQMPYQGALASQLLAAYHEQETAPDSKTVEQFCTLQDAIRLWGDNHMIPPNHPVGPSSQQVRQAIDHIRVPDHQPDATEDNPWPVRTRRKLLLDQLWLECSVVWQMKQQIQKERTKVYSFPLVVPRPLRHVPIYLYVFSGRRRPGDFQQHLETLLFQRQLSGHVLLLDLAISNKHDVNDRELVHKLINWVRMGVVGGVLVAPPCETWTEARFLTTENLRDPRPLRSNQEPMGLPQLTLRELEQLGISNYLLYVAIRLVFHCALCATPAILEHPKEPRNKDRPSIWRLPWLQALKASNLLAQRLIWQAEYGSHVAKPTHLGVTHIPEFRDVMNKHRQPVQWRELETLGGKDSQGRWTTAAAKEYPSTLNLALADCFVTAAQRRMDANDEPIPVPTAIRHQFEELYAGDSINAVQTMQPDFHRTALGLMSLD